MFFFFFLIFQVSSRNFYGYELSEFNPVININNAESLNLKNFLFYDKNQINDRSTFFNVNFFITTTRKNEIEISYDLQAQQLLEYLNSNTEVKLTSKNKIASSPSLQEYSNTNDSKNSITSFQYFNTTYSSYTTIKSKNPTHFTSFLISTKEIPIEPNKNTTRLTLNSSTNLPFLTNKNITQVVSTRDRKYKSEELVTEIGLAKIPYKKILAESIIKDINYTYNIKLGINYKDQDFNCLNCTNILNKNDCESYSIFDFYGLIDTFCCQCNFNKKKIGEEETTSTSDSSIKVSKEENGKLKKITIILVIILLSILVLIILVYGTIWIYGLFTNDSDIDDSESDSKKSIQSKKEILSNIKNQENQDEKKTKTEHDDDNDNDDYDDKSTINSNDSIDFDNQVNSKRYTNLKNVNKNNNNSRTNEIISKKTSTSPQNKKARHMISNDSLLDTKTVECDQFNNKPDSKLDYSVDYKIKNEKEISIFDRRNHLNSDRNKKDFHHNCKKNLTVSSLSSLDSISKKNAIKTKIRGFVFK
ncbi:unnamed protein product [Brachionus calyciflorus]|uniref:Uncharacterized protein n=1 Tax=Brachionus calyciflorus TaxID=104777 RepID=A0A813VT89_9BILA|nr:unnamed protein product [Brachionus calyciflorus]